MHPFPQKLTVASALISTWTLLTSYIDYFWTASISEYCTDPMSICNGDNLRFRPKLSFVLFTDCRCLQRGWSRTMPKRTRKNYEMQPAFEERIVIVLPLLPLQFQLGGSTKRRRRRQPMPEWGAGVDWRRMGALSVFTSFLDSADTGKRKMRFTLSSDRRDRRNPQPRSYTHSRRRRLSERASKTEWISCVCKCKLCLLPGYLAI